mmetsp:Transcript_92128/g.177613  ORF Transcript_92128/g.177613 Transcript_92128/m.177613 type:complete len:91 (-) Transcript_92128:3-275(-)
MLYKSSRNKMYLKKNLLCGNRGQPFSTSPADDVEDNSESEPSSDDLPARSEDVSDSLLTARYPGRTTCCLAWLILQKGPYRRHAPCSHQL